MNPDANSGSIVYLVYSQEGKQLAPRAAFSSKERADAYISANATAALDDWDWLSFVIDDPQATPPAE